MVETEANISEYLSDFLDFLANVEESYRIASDNLEESGRELCDLQHYLELVPCSGPRMMQVSKKMREVLQKRRKAKDEIALCELILEWKDNNKPSLRALSEALGRVRKQEYWQNTRTYTVRSDILSEYTSNTHLSSHLDRSGDDSVSRNDA